MANPRGGYEPHPKFKTWPDTTPTPYSALAVQCYSLDPAQRPSFGSISAQLAAMMEQAVARGGPGGEGGGDGQQQVGWQQQQEEDQRSAFASKAAAAGLLGHAPPSLEHRQAEAGAGAAGVEAAEAGVEAAEGRGVGGEATAGGEEAHPATPPRGPSSSQGAGGEAHPATPHPGLPLPSSSQEAAAPTLASAAPPTSSASGGSSSGSARPPHGSGTMGTSAPWGGAVRRARLARGRTAGHGVGHTAGLGVRGLRARALCLRQMRGGWVSGIRCMSRCLTRGARHACPVHSCRRLQWRNPGRL